MNTDARISVGLPNHPKTKKLIRRLGPSGSWALVRLFLWASQNRPGGDLSGLSDEDIELAVDWPEKPGALVSALVEVRFVDGAEGARAIHDWGHHNPWAAGHKDRSDKARKAGLVSRYGKEKGERMFHAGQANSQLQVNGESYSSPALVSAPYNPVSLPSPSPTPLPKDKKTAGAVVETKEIPSWLTEKAWSEYRQHRKTMRKPLSPLSESKALTVLAGLVADGNDAVAVIDQSIANGWAGLFAIKNGANNGTRTTSRHGESLAGRSEAAERSVASRTP